MKNKELIEQLKLRDPEGTVQVFVQDDLQTYYDLAKVNGFVNGPDTVLEAGEVRCVG
jgi:hypothetical protein